MMDSENQNARRLIGRLGTNALSVKYERQYGASAGNLEIVNLMNNPLLKGEVRIFGAGFTEEFSSLFRQEPLRLAIS